MDKENKLILYKDEEGRVSVNTRFADEDVWLTQSQLAEIYCTTKQILLSRRFLKLFKKFFCFLKCNEHRRNLRCPLRNVY